MIYAICKTTLGKSDDIYKFWINLAMFVSENFDLLCIILSAKPLKLHKLFLFWSLLLYQLDSLNHSRSCIHTVLQYYACGY